jgi:hypothetical protein
MILLNFGERIPGWLCHGVSEQNTKKILNGIGFPASSAARSFNGCFCFVGNKQISG